MRAAGGSRRRCLALTQAHSLFHKGSTVPEQSPKDKHAPMWKSGWALVLLAGLFALAATFLSAVVGAWGDEAMALSTASYGPAEAAMRAREFELQPPFYFVLLALWRFVADSVFWARMLSVLAVVAGLLAADRYFRVEDESTPDIGSGRLLTLLLATSPFALWAAAEARVYALALALSLAWVCLFWRGFLAPDEREGQPWRWNAGLVLVSCLLLATQYYTGFLLLAGAPAILVARGWRPLGRYVGLMLVTGLVLFPILRHVPDQMERHGAEPVPGAEAPGPVDVLAFGIHRTETLVLPPVEATGRLLQDGAVRQGALWAVRLALVTLLGTALLQAWRRRSRRVAGLLTLPTSLLLLYMLLRFRVPDHLLADRHLVALVPPSLASLAALLSYASHVVRRATVALLMVGGLVVSVIRWAPLSKTGYAREVASVLDREASPGDVVLVYRPSLAAALALEYDGPAALVALPQPLNLRLADLTSGAGQSLADTAAIAARIDSALSNASGAWLVVELAPHEHFGRVYFDRFERLIQRRFPPSPPVATFPGVQVRRLSGR